MRLGLSLCIQGTHDPSDADGLELRFIPVYTGNTNKYMTVVRNFPVYPCVYREHDDKDVFNNLWNGLSLCIQGTL